MKNRALFFFVVMTASFHVSGQDTVYFTKTWKPCPKNDSYYYRVLTKDTAGYKVSDHFPNGTIQMVGYSRSKDTVKLDGPCAFYTEKGRITKQGFYKNDHLWGQWRTYYPDGSINDVRLLRGLDPKIDEEVLEVVKKMPPWEPGRQDGRPIGVQFNLPVAFRL